jgi:heat shock protein HtpX
MGDRLALVQRGYAIETALLFVALAALLTLIGWLVGGPGGVAVALGFALLTGRLLAGLSSDVIMRFARGRPVHQAEAPNLYGRLARLARRARLPAVPRLYVLASDVPNAITTGEGDDAAIGLSRGLLYGLDDRELEGVLAHELAHIQSGDTRVIRLAGALVETIRVVAQVGLMICLVAYFVGEPVPLPLPVLFALAPLVGFGLQLWLSRRREFAADARAIALTGDAAGLARALCRLDRYRSRLRALGYGLGAPPSWLSTHPPTAERLARLEALQPQAFLPSAPPRVFWTWSA